jgi:hypothetical protein
MHPTLAIEIVYRSQHVTAGKLFHGSLEVRVFLPHDFAQPRGLHPRLL